MFIGHFGVGLAAKKIDSRPSLGTFFMASQFVDLLWPLFLLLGLERVKVEAGNTAFTPLDFIYYPFSHSLLAAIIWGLLFGIIYFLIKKNYKTSILMGLLVLSHWVLDFITHRPDLPLVPWSAYKVGLGMWNSVILTIIVEGSIFIIGAYLYLTCTKAKNKTGKITFWSLIVFLALIYINNIFSSPPPSEEAIGIVGLSQWIIVFWGYWIDRNRENIQNYQLRTENNTINM